MKFPTINLTLGGVLGIAAVLLGGIAVLYLYSKRSSLIQAVNPLDEKNAANQAVTSIVTAATGRDETLGGLLAEWFDPATRAVDRSLSNPAP